MSPSEPKRYDPGRNRRGPAEQADEAQVDAILERTTEGEVPVVTSPSVTPPPAGTNPVAARAATATAGGAGGGGAAGRPSPSVPAPAPGDATAVPREALAAAVALVVLLLLWMRRRSRD